MIRSFGDLVNKLKKEQQILKVAAAAAEDSSVVDSLLEAQEERIADPIFIGNKAEISKLLKMRGKDPSQFNIIPASSDIACQCAIDLVKEGSAHVLMKGILDSRVFLEPIVKKDNNLRTGEIISHIAFFELPNYHKLLMTTDGGMVMYPGLDEKRRIINNATTALRAMGYALPKHAVVCAIEKENLKMVETIDAAALKKMNETGDINDCIVEGPISYDVAMNKDIARHKGYHSPYVGDFDCLIMPNIHAGNILGKCFTVTACALMAGVIVGAKVPIVMTSRGSDAKEKLYSIAMAMVIAAGNR